MNEIREETFALYYFSEGGIQYSDIHDMSSDERSWHINRLLKQKKEEKQAIRTAQGTPSAKPSKRRRRR